MSEFSKENGQIFTPVGVVNMILDSVKYSGKNILKKTIMEPAFGKGVFLIEIISRIIHEAKASGKSVDEIKHIIETSVYGIEKDKALYDEAVSKLNDLLSAYDIPLPNWNNLMCGDTLLLYKKFVGKMDFCVGNPPYVRIHNIQNDYRDIVKDFEFAKGTTDLYIIFYEIGIKFLKKSSGRLSYTTPNSFLRNTSQKLFRNYLVDNNFLSAIYDFKDSKLFNADTYTCICVIDKNLHRITKDVIDYREYNMYNMVIHNAFKYDYFRKQLKDATWNLSSEEDIVYLQQNSKRPIKIRSIANVQNGIATNRDSVYVGSVYLDKDCLLPYYGKHTDKLKLVWFNGYLVESTILHRCVKASKFNGNLTNNYILFPYFNNPKTKLINKTNGLEVATNYIPYSEDVLKDRFPYAYQYLQNHWEDLGSRDMDTNADWFVFGRSQGLSNSGYKKLVFKHVISKSATNMEVYIVDEDVIVYSGIYITIDISPFIDSYALVPTFNDGLYNQTLKEVKDILQSSDFYRYCLLVGKNMQGGYVAVSSVFVKNYGTMLTQFPNLPVNVPKEDFPIADSNYMNKLFTNKFVDCIKESYDNMAICGTTSTERVKPFHSFIAKVLKYKLGQDYDVIADGYSFSSEASVRGNFDFKKVDICVMKKEKIMGAIAFKLLSNNFKQNYKNFSEGMLGETVQMKGSGIPYAFCYLIPEKALYRRNVDKNSGLGEFSKFDILTQNDVKVYYDIANDPSYKNRTPDAMFIGIHKLFTDDYLNSLKSGNLIDISSDDYLNAIQPKWSDLEFVNDEDIKLFYLEQLNLGTFLDRFIKKMNIIL